MKMLIEFRFAVLRQHLALPLPVFFAVDEFQTAIDFIV